MSNLITIAICLLAGLILQRVRSFPQASAAEGLNAFAIHIALPALIVQQVSGLELSSEVLVPALIPWVLLGVSAIAVKVLAKAAGWTRETTGALLLIVPLGNTSFVGIPLVLAWIGPEALPWAVLYDQLGSFLALATWGTLITATYGEGSESESRPTAKAIGLRVLRFPPFLALSVAIAVNLLSPSGLPELIDESIGLVAKSLVPTVLVAVGLKWRLGMPRVDFAPFGAALAIKLALMPVLAWALLRLVGASGVAADTTVLEAGMGPMITASALGIAAGIKPRLIAAITGYGTLSSLGTTGLVKLLLLPV